MLENDVKDEINDVKDEICQFIIDDICINLSEDDDFIEEEKDLNFFVAGGSILSSVTYKEINDYDLYFYTEEDFKLFKKIIDRYASVTGETDRAITYVRDGVTFQATKVFGTPEEIFDKFDYNVCMVALPITIQVDGDIIVKDFIFDKNFIRGVLSRELIFNPKTLYPLNSLFRLRKYIAKGYRINNKEFFKIACAVNKLKIETIEDFQNQCFGMSGEIMDEISKYIDDNYRDKTKVIDIIEFVEELDKKLKLSLWEEQEYGSVL